MQQLRKLKNLKTRKPQELKGEVSSLKFDVYNNEQVMCIYKSEEREIGFPETEIG